MGSKPVCCCWPACCVIARAPDPTRNSVPLCSPLGRLCPGRSGQIGVVLREGLLGGTGRRGGRGLPPVLLVVGRVALDVCPPAPTRAGWGRSATPGCAGRRGSTRRRCRSGTAAAARPPPSARPAPAGPPGASCRGSTAAPRRPGRSPPFCPYSCRASPGRGRAGHRIAGGGCGSRSDRGGLVRGLSAACRSRCCRTRSGRTGRGRPSGWRAPRPAGAAGGGFASSGSSWFLPRNVPMMARFLVRFYPQRPIPNPTKKRGIRLDAPLWNPLHCRRGDSNPYGLAPTAT